MTLDIERLDAVLSGKAVGRGCGRTTAMIVRMLTKIDFIQPPAFFYVYCGNRVNAERIFHETKKIAVEMGYFVDIRTRTHSLKIFSVSAAEPIRICFMSVENYTDCVGIDPNRVFKFYDHYFVECNFI